MLIDYIRAGKYLEALEALAGDKLLQRILKARGELDNVALTLAELALALENAPVQRVEALLDRLGVKYDPRLFERLARYGAAALDPALRRLIECYERLCDPGTVLNIVANIGRDKLPVARILALLYIEKYIEKHGLNAKLADIAERVGLGNIASMIRGAIDAMTKIPEALRETFQEYASKILDLAEKIRELSQRVVQGDINALENLLTYIDLAKKYASMVGLKLPDIEALKMAAVAAALMANPSAYARIAEIARKHGVNIPVYKPSVSDAVCILALLGYPGAIEEMTARGWTRTPLCELIAKLPREELHYIAAPVIAWYMRYLSERREWRKLLDLLNWLRGHGYPVSDKLLKEVSILAYLEDYRPVLEEALKLIQQGKRLPSDILEKLRMLRDVLEAARGVYPQAEELLRNIHDMLVWNEILDAYTDLVERFRAALGVPNYSEAVRRNAEAVGSGSIESLIRVSFAETLRRLAARLLERPPRLPRCETDWCRRIEESIIKTWEGMRASVRWYNDIVSMLDKANILMMEGAALVNRGLKICSEYMTCANAYETLKEGFMKLLEAYKTLEAAIRAARSPPPNNVLPDDVVEKMAEDLEKQAKKYYEDLMRQVEDLANKLNDYWLIKAIRDAFAAEHMEPPRLPEGVAGRLEHLAEAAIGFMERVQKFYEDRAREILDAVFGRISSVHDALGKILEVLKAVGLAGLSGVAAFVTGIGKYLVGALTAPLFIAAARIMQLEDLMRSDVLGAALEEAKLVEGFAAGLAEPVVKAVQRGDVEDLLAYIASMWLMAEIGAKLRTRLRAARPSRIISIIEKSLVPELAGAGRLFRKIAEWAAKLAATLRAELERGKVEPEIVIRKLGEEVQSIEITSGMEPEMAEHTISIIKDMISKLSPLIADEILRRLEAALAELRGRPVSAVEIAERLEKAVKKGSIEAIEEALRSMPEFVKAFEELKEFSKRLAEETMKPTLASMEHIVNKAIALEESIKEYMEVFERVKPLLEELRRAGYRFEFLKPEKIVEELRRVPIEEELRKIRSAIERFKKLEIGFEEFRREVADALRRMGLEDYAERASRAETLGDLAHVVREAVRKLELQRAARLYEAFRAALQRIVQAAGALLPALRALSERLRAEVSAALAESIVAKVEELPEQIRQMIRGKAELTLRDMVELARKLLKRAETEPAWKLYGLLKATETLEKLVKERLEAAAATLPEDLRKLITDTERLLREAEEMMKQKMREARIAFEIIREYHPEILRELGLPEAFSLLDIDKVLEKLREIIPRLDREESFWLVADLENLLSKLEEYRASWELLEHIRSIYNLARTHLERVVNIAEFADELRRVAEAARIAGLENLAEMIERIADLIERRKYRDAAFLLQRLIETIRKVHDPRKVAALVDTLGPAFKLLADFAPEILETLKDVERATGFTGMAVRIGVFRSEAVRALTPEALQAIREVFKPGEVTREYKCCMTTFTVTEKTEVLPGKTVKIYEIRGPGGHWVKVMIGFEKIVRNGEEWIGRIVDVVFDPDAEKRPEIAALLAEAAKKLLDEELPKMRHVVFLDESGRFENAFESLEKALSEKIGKYIDIYKALMGAISNALVPTAAGVSKTVEVHNGEIRIRVNTPFGTFYLKPKIVGNRVVFEIEGNPLAAAWAFSRDESIRRLVPGPNPHDVIVFIENNAKPYKVDDKTIYAVPSRSMSGLINIVPAGKLRFLNLPYVNISIPVITITINGRTFNISLVPEETLRRIIGEYNRAKQGQGPGQKPQQKPKQTPRQTPRQTPKQTPKQKPKQAPPSPPSPPVPTFTPLPMFNVAFAAPGARRITVTLLQREKLVF